MTYRDELGQAHERIAQLEGQLREEKEKSAALAQATAAPRRSPALKVGVGVAIAGVIIGAIVGAATLRSAASTSAMLVKPVDDVVRDQARFRNIHLRVYGDVLRGSYAKQEEPCQVWMVLEKRGVLLTVHVPHCQMPASFKSDTGMAVTAEGELRADGTFEASAIALTP